MHTLVLYSFQFRDPLTGKWIRARYKAELHEPAARYAEQEIVGPPEIPHVAPTSAEPLIRSDRQLPSGHHRPASTR